MNFTNIMVSIIIAMAVVTGVNTFAGDVFTQYGTSADLGMDEYGYSNSTNSYINSVSTMNQELEETTNAVPGTEFTQVLMSGLFWVMASIKTFATIPFMLKDLALGLGTTATGTGLISFPAWTGGAIALLIGVSIVGYLLYLLVGRGDKHGEL